MIYVVTCCRCCALCQHVPGLARWSPSAAWCTRTNSRSHWKLAVIMNLPTAFCCSSDPGICVKCCYKYVCMSVCQSTSIAKIIRPNCIKFCVYVACICGSVFLWKQSSTLCMSHSVDDVFTWTGCLAEHRFDTVADTVYAQSYLSGAAPRVKSDVCDCLVRCICFCYCHCGTGIREWCLFIINQESIYRPFGLGQKPKELRLVGDDGYLTTGTGWS